MLLVKYHWNLDFCTNNTDGGGNLHESVYKASISCEWLIHDDDDDDDDQVSNYGGRRAQRRKTTLQSLGLRHFNFFPLLAKRVIYYLRTLAPGRYERY